MVISIFRKLIRTILVFSIVITNYVISAELDYAKLSSATDKLLQARIKPENPGCAIGIIHQGEYVHKAGYGMANLEHNIPIASNSIFRIGSLSKQFTAMSVALLVEQGKIDLDVDIHQYLPELMDYEHQVTVRQMIHHIAGMGDYDHKVFTKLDGVDFRFGNQDFLTNEEFYAKVSKANLSHKPESKWQYSNLAYYLLSQVIEKTSGKTLRKFAETEIFNKLKMSSTLFYDNVNEPVSNRVDGYKKLENGRYEIFMTNLGWVGDGGIYTNLDDFIAWDRNFYQNKLGNGKNELIKTITTPHPLAIVERDNKSVGGYAYGLFINNSDQQPLISHTGGWVGFNTYYGRYPDIALSVVAFCSSTDNSAYDLGQNAVDLYIAALNE